MEMIVFVFAFFSFSLVIITVRKDRREYIEWEKVCIKIERINLLSFS